VRAPKESISALILRSGLLAASRRMAASPLLHPSFETLASQAPQDEVGDTLRASQLRFAVLLDDDEPNSAFFKSLIPSESRGQSQEKEC
jgi:hypothetical protein